MWLLGAKGKGLIICCCGVFLLVSFALNVYWYHSGEGVKPDRQAAAALIIAPAFILFGLNMLFNGWLEKFIPIPWLRLSRLAMGTVHKDLQSNKKWPAVLWTIMMLPFILGCPAFGLCIYCLGLFCTSSQKVWQAEATAALESDWVPGTANFSDDLKKAVVQNEADGSKFTCTIQKIVSESPISINGGDTLNCQVHSYKESSSVNNGYPAVLVTERYRIWCLPDSKELVSRSV